MDIFGDKTYEQLDWMTKAVEPIVYSLNEIFSLIPKELEVTYDLIIDRDSVNSMYIDTALIALAKKHNICISHENLHELGRFYEFQIGGAPVLDLNHKMLIGGTIKVIRTKDSFTEDELKNIMETKGYTILRSIDKTIADQSRLNELLDLMGHAEGMKKRSISGKKGELINAFSIVMRDNKWNIRNVDLAIKVAEWMKQYAEYGNLAAMTNFCKLKAITHRGYPIYSIEEEK